MCFIVIAWSQGRVLCRTVLCRAVLVVCLIVSTGGQRCGLFIAVCRYRVCNSPYPLPNKTCAGDPEGLHYSLELRSCLDGQTCNHVSTDSSFVVVAVCKLKPLAGAILGFNHCGCTITL